MHPYKVSALNRHTIWLYHFVTVSCWILCC